MPRKLPELNVLMEHARQGLTNKQIAEMYGASDEAVRQQFAKAGVRRGPERADHGRYLPWRIRADHVGDYCAKRLRAFSKREQGWELSEQESKLLDEFLEYMDGDNPWGAPLSVWYSKTEGFWVQRRRDGDRDYIHPPQAAASRGAA